MKLFSGSTLNGKQLWIVHNGTFGGGEHNPLVDYVSFHAYDDQENYSVVALVTIEFKDGKQIDAKINRNDTYVKPGTLLDIAIEVIAEGSDNCVGVLVEPGGKATLQLTTDDIGKISLKTAENLLATLRNANQNPYNESIIKGADKLCAMGYRTAKYVTQYASGTTFWSHGDGKHSSVDRNGDAYLNA